MASDEQVKSAGASFLFSAAESWSQNPHPEKPQGCGTRLIIGGTPYSILNRVHGKRVIISTIWHSAQSK